MIYLFVGLGGFIGAILRFSVYRMVEHALPIATMIVNLLGCLIAGIIIGLSFKDSFISEHVRVGVSIGLLGAFTTFSTFSLENYVLLQEGKILILTGNIILQVFLGILFIYLGRQLSLALFS